MLVRGETVMPTCRTSPRARPAEEPSLALAQHGLVLGEETGLVARALSGREREVEAVGPHVAAEDEELPLADRPRIVASATQVCVLNENGSRLSRFVAFPSSQLR